MAKQGKETRTEPATNPIGAGANMTLESVIITKDPQGGRLSLPLNTQRFRMRGSPLRLVAVAGGAIMAGVFTLSFVTSVSMQAFQAVLESKKKKTAPRCIVCKGKGLMDCKLCRGRSVIDWTPLYNPPVTSLCVCPTCDGDRVQRCLNCAGRGYT